MKHIKKFNEESTNNKRYICPMDLYGGSVKAGDIFIPCRNENYYMPEDKDQNRFTGCQMPVEIVQTWEIAK